MVSFLMLHTTLESTSFIVIRFVMRNEHKSFVSKRWPIYFMAAIGVASHSRWRHGSIIFSILHAKLAYRLFFSKTNNYRNILF